MNESILGEEDEFRGLGDDLIVKVKPSVKTAVTPKAPVVELSITPRIKKTKRQKALRVMYKRSGISTIPPVEKILSGKTGPKFKISEIGFISNDDQKDSLMAELAKECPVRNRLNRDDVLKSRVLVVGSQIFKAGRMWSPIHAYRNIDDGRIECIGGRHRLAFLALIYGSDLEVPVYLENLDLNAAREAVAVANDSRPIKALERTSYAVLRAVGGNADAGQDPIYDRMATHKANIGKYCVYSVIERGYPAKLDFQMAELSSRPNGEITTVSNIEKFWNEAFGRGGKEDRKKFDVELKESVRFLNSFGYEIGRINGFNPDAHLSAKVMAAVGRYYQAYRKVVGKDVISICIKMAKGVVMIDPTSKPNFATIYDSIDRQVRV